MVRNSKLIYDIGMHTGRDTEFYLKKGFDVVAIEANPSLVEQAKQKFCGEIERGQLVIIDKALSDKTGSTDFFIFANKDDWGSIDPEWNKTMDSDVKSIVVQTITLEELVKKFGVPYYMKIDIEGADILCLKSLLTIKERPTYVSVELLTPNNFATKNDVDCLDILCHLKALGYNKFKISDQSKNDMVKCPNPPLEGSFVDYIFDGYSSGLFGKELPGAWMRIDELTLRYLDYYYKMGNITSFMLNNQTRNSFSPHTSLMFHEAGWFDIHATIE